MSLTLLAIMFTPFYLKLVLDPKGTNKIMKDLSKSPASLLILSIVYITLAALILSFTGLNFAWSLDSLLSWLGLIIFLKGILILIPDVYGKTIKKLNEKNYPIFGFLGLVLMLLLVYVDLKILA